MSQAATIMHGKLQGTDVAFRGVSTDSRTVSAGELFVALTGPNFDGSRFVAQAAEQGAAGAVVQRDTAARLPTIRVDDARLALGRLGNDWRQRMPATVIGLTGSNGKTTLRAMVASILQPLAPTLATRGNLNNDIGLPLMLLGLDAEHRYAVFEMGANHAGEIAYLTSLAMPAIVAITNAAAAHLEGFGSIDGVAEAKGEILQGSNRPQIAVLNADDRYFSLWRSLAADLEVLSFGRGDDATVQVSDVRTTANGSVFTLRLPRQTVTATLPLPGSHNVVNACAAAAVAHAAGIAADAIIDGLARVQPVGGRLQALAGRAGSRLYDDSYNANPSSVLAAAKYLAAADGERWLVLGDMGELGDTAARLHRTVGRDIRRTGIDRLFATGPLCRDTVAGFGRGAAWFDDVDALVASVRDALHPGVSVLVKGSRFMRMERVVAALRAAPADSGGQ